MPLPATASRGAGAALHALVPARFWRRAAAWSLDAAIVGLPVAALAWSPTQRALLQLHAAMDALLARMTSLLMETMGAGAADPMQLATQWSHDPGVLAAIDAVQRAAIDSMQPMLLGFVVLGALYWIGFERSGWQATPGKRALGLRVSDLDGRAPGTLRVVGRHAAGALSWLLLNLGHALAAVPPQRRALHDHLAGARVLQDAAADAPLPGWARLWLAAVLLASAAVPVWLALQARGAMAAALAGVV